MKSTALSAFNCILLCCLSLVTSGCGGGSSSSPAAPTTAVSGSVLAGPVSGASVTVKTVGGTLVAGPVATDGTGSYTIAVPTAALASELVFEASGGAYPDEATATAGVALGALTARMAAGTLAAGSFVSLDPSSTIVEKLMAGGMARTAAEGAFSAAFGYTPNCSVKPAFAALSSAATDAQWLAGLRAAAFSQLTRDLGLAPAKQSELLQALADDLADGTLDGREAGGAAAATASGTPIPADIGNRFCQAFMTFQTSSLNKSKLTADKVGTLPFNTVALTAGYKVEYLPGTAAAAQGKTSFRLRLTNLADGTPAAGKTVTLTPFMHMATTSHSAPADAVTDNGDGTYACVVYYQMASGSGMGVWELRVAINGETASFYPPVAMAMGSTPRVVLKGVADKVPAMTGGAAARTYNIFNDGLSGMGPFTFKLFIAALDDAMMMKFPAVSAGSTLHDQTGAAWTVAAMTVQVSTDGTAWVNATDNGAGHWSASGLTGLASGGTVSVRVTVNGEQKTTDGAPLAGANGSGAFTIVPGM